MDSLELYVEFSSQTFKIGRMGELPIFVFASNDSYEGIENEKKIRAITESARTFKALTMRHEFKKTFVYGRFITWCDLYINNLPTEQTINRGKIE